MYFVRKVAVFGKQNTVSEPQPSHPTPQGCSTDPTNGLNKEIASSHSKSWWVALPPTDITIFSDGSEQHTDGVRHTGYGFVVYQNSKQIAWGCGAINPLSHAFDGVNKL
jgi:hypothetical protein